MNVPRVLLTGILVFFSGCICSHYSYRLDPQDRGTWTFDRRANEFIEGRVWVEYMQHSVVAAKSRELLSPVTRHYPFVLLPFLPFYIVFEAPVCWVAKKEINYSIRHRMPLQQVDAAFIRCFQREFGPALDPSSTIPMGAWQAICELRWATPPDVTNRVFFSEQRGRSGWRYKFSIHDGSGIRDVACSLLDSNNIKEGRRGGAKLMWTLDGETIYFFNHCESSEYIDYFWRTDGKTVSVAILKLDMKTGEISKMMWFEHGRICVSEEVFLEESSLRTCCGLFDCEFEKSRK